MRRYLVEGAVIVLSILLAFGIDAMWAQHQERLEEQQILASLKSDFVANLNSVTRVIDAHILFRERAARLLRLTPDEIRGLSQTERSELILAAANPWTYDAVLGTTHTLINGGKLNVLRDPRLRQSLLTFLNRVADSTEDIDYLVNGAEDFWEGEIRHGGPWSDPATEIGYIGEIKGLEFIPKISAEQLIAVQADPIAMGHSKRFHINAAYYIQELQMIKAQVEEILSLIDEAAD